MRFFSVTRRAAVCMLMSGYCNLPFIGCWARCLSLVVRTASELPGPPGHNMPNHAHRGVDGTDVEFFLPTGYRQVPDSLGENRLLNRSQNKDRGWKQPVKH